MAITGMDFDDNSIEAALQEGETLERRDRKRSRVQVEGGRDGSPSVIIVEVPGGESPDQYEPRRSRREEYRVNPRYKNFPGLQADIPTNVIDTPDRDGLYLLTFCIDVKHVDPSASTGAILQFFGTCADGTSFGSSSYVDLTSFSTALHVLQMTVPAMSNTPILWSFTGGGSYNTAIYDAFASALRLA